MTNKKLLAVVAVLLVLVTASWVLATQTAPADGQGPTYRGRGPRLPLDEATIKLKGQLYMKRLEMLALLTAPQLDEAKANALYPELIKLKDELSQKRFAAKLDFMKKNPDWQPRHARNGLKWRGEAFRKSGPRLPLDEATIKLKGQLYTKKLELVAAMTSPKLDEAKANALHAELIKFKDELSQKRFAVLLDFKKKNPDWQPRLGGRS
ncbi:MAG: hypothetical protein HQK55_13210 [Deltaproteobacteria bacterium]|nr:hypothetical protein [Deltaproteobacteria bacterium]